MRSLSLLLLDKNTQVVNTHGLVGGLLYSTEAYPFMDRGSLPEGTDLNTVKVSGIYRTNGGNNFPDTEDDFPLTFSILKIYKSGYALVQEITNVNYNYINHFYIRVSQDEGNTWYSWKKIL